MILLNGREIKSISMVSKDTKIDNTQSDTSQNMSAPSSVHKMDAELRCPACRNYFHHPILLPCGHSLCYSCAGSSLLPADESRVVAAFHTALQLGTPPPQPIPVSSKCSTGLVNSSSSASSSCSSSSNSVSKSGPNNPALSDGGVSSRSSNSDSNNSSSVGTTGSDHSDQLSVVSESDSGVVVVSSSRPGSLQLHHHRLEIFICPSSRPSTASTSEQAGGATATNITCGLLCPACNRVVGLLDSKGIDHFPRNKALEHLLVKFVASHLCDIKSVAGSDLKFSDPTQLDLYNQLNRPGGPLCQLCDEPNESVVDSPDGNVAKFWCEQCDIFYCLNCRERCHPSRGPLARHALHSAQKGVALVRQRLAAQPSRCPVHQEHLLDLYCNNCRTSVCQTCISAPASIDDDPTIGHSKHDVQPLATCCKAKKTELSHALQMLSEKARRGSEHIQRLRSRSEQIDQNASESERHLDAQLNALIGALEQKRAELTGRLRHKSASRIQGLKEQVSQLTFMLTRSTGLIQFCIEMLKESDPTAFLTTSQALINRTQEADHLFGHELEQVSLSTSTTNQQQSIRDTDSLLSTSSTNSSSSCSANRNPPLTSPVRHPSTSSHRHSRSARTTPTKQYASTKHSSCKRVASQSKQQGSDFCLVDSSTIEQLMLLIGQLGVREERGKKFEARFQSGLAILEVPTAPLFRVEECLSERNVITLAWQPGSRAKVDSYTLELDDGAGGSFRKVYRGSEPICTVEGLHFRSIYRARVKAHNQTGDSAYSEHLCLQTSDFTWFNLDAAQIGSNTSSCLGDILVTNGNRTVTSQINEDRVILGSTGLSRGVHYWEFTVDRCDLGGQPAFGLAKSDCNKEVMLGMDMRSWAVYFDAKRSWFLHNGEHFERTDGGVAAGSVVGIRFDANRGSLSYYVNDEPHGPIAFTNLPSGLYYPAVSLTRSVQLTLHAGLEAPSESEESDEDSSGNATNGTETMSMATTVLLQPPASTSIGKTRL